MVNLLEEVALLAFRDDKGSNGAPYLQWSLAGAALLELSLNERITVTDKLRVEVVDSEPLGHPAIDEALTRVAGATTRHVATWVTTLSGVDLRTPVLQGLVDQRVLTHEQARRLGFIRVDRYHPANPGVEDEIRARLDRAHSHAVGADARTAALAGVVCTTFMEQVAMPQHKFGAVNKTFAKLAQDHPKVAEVVDGIRAAVTAFRSTAGTVAAT